MKDLRIRIGNVELENNIFLSPMADVTDLPFRLICKKQGCGLVVTEMVSSKGLIYGNQNTEKMLAIAPEEGVVSLQIFGCEPEIMAKAAQIVQQKSRAQIIDINMGCPAPKIVKNGEGSALLLEPQKIGKIVKAVTEAVTLPVTVKIRKGFDDSQINAVEVAKIIEENGAAAVQVHGRTRKQFYEGKADWEIISKVKEAVSIPVIGNGDVFSPQDAERMLEQTGCDGILIGRGCLGNPWIFSRTIEYLKTGKLLPEPTIQDRVEMLLYHAKQIVEYKGEYIGIREMRKHSAWYIKGIRGASEARKDLNHIENVDQLQTILNKLMNGHYEK